MSPLNVSALTSGAAGAVETSRSMLPLKVWAVDAARGPPDDQIA